MPSGSKKWHSSQNWEAQERGAGSPGCGRSCGLPRRTGHSEAQGRHWELPLNLLQAGPPGSPVRRGRTLGPCCS